METEPSELQTNMSRKEDYGTGEHSDDSSSSTSTLHDIVATRGNDSNVKAKDAPPGGPQIPETSRPSSSASSAASPTRTYAEVASTPPPPGVAPTPVQRSTPPAGAQRKSREESRQGRPRRETPPAGVSSLVATAKDIQKAAGAKTSQGERAQKSRSPTSDSEAEPASTGARSKTKAILEKFGLSTPKTKGKKSKTPKTDDSADRFRMSLAGASLDVADGSRLPSTASASDSSAGVVGGAYHQALSPPTTAAQSTTTVATSDERVGHGRPRKYSYQSASRQMDVALEEAREKLKRVEAFQRSPGAAESSNEDVHVSNLSLFCMLCPFLFFFFF